MQTRFDNIFKQGGLLSKNYPDYESRPSQLSMANLIGQAIKEKKYAIIEGATGVGKSFSYLIPSILSGKSIVVSTSNKNLQDQLYKKDLPYLHDILEKDFSYAVLKGRANYFSFMMFEMNQKLIQKVLSNKEIEIIRNWAKKELAEKGMGEINDLPIDISYEAKILMTGSSYVKPEKDSPYCSIDFGEKAREKAKNSQVLLVNHTLLALNAAILLKSEGKAKIFPTPDILIVDEAHAFEHYAQLAFSDKLNKYSLKHFLRHALVKQLCTRKKTADIESNFVQTLHVNYTPPIINGYYKDTPYDNFKLKKYSDQLESCVKELKSAKEKMDELGQIQISVLIKEGKNLVERLKKISEKNKLGRR